MTQIEIASRARGSGGDLARVLDAACAAFEVLLTAICAQQDRLGGRSQGSHDGRGVRREQPSGCPGGAVPAPSQKRWEPPTAGSWPGGTSGTRRRSWATHGTTAGPSLTSCATP